MPWLVLASRSVAKPQSKSAGRRAAARDDATSGYADRRAEILRAAAGVFKSRGLRGSTFSHVAEALGTDRASLYYYFSSKEELFQELVSEAVRVNLDAATAVSKEKIDAPEKLRRIIEALMVSYGEFYPVLYLLIQENLSHVAPEHQDWADGIREVNRKYEKLLVRIIEQGQKDGTIRTHAPPWVLAYGIIGMVGWSNRWFNPADSELSAEEIGKAFADTVLDGLAV